MADEKAEGHQILVVEEGKDNREAIYKPVESQEMKEVERDIGAVPFPDLPTFDDHQTPERVDIELFPFDRAFLLRNILSPFEASFICKKGDEIGIAPLDYSTGYKVEYRNNDRLIIRSDQIANLLWDRVKHHFKKITITAGNKENFGLTSNMEGEWEPIGFNSTFRLCRYHPGGHFAPHYDGHYLRSPTVRSLKTFMFYLNSDFEGGSTNWVSEDQFLFQDKETGIFRAEEKHVIGGVEPETGLALVFDHHILHEGQQLRSGTKYILRTEVMYSQQSCRELDPREAKAMQLLEEAQEAEFNKECMKAAELYRRAFKLWPDFEKQVT
mmetsp:Transcript_32432/g.44540  ORF Transcript_32432/g.44540 Transcript_32432/m.44540 type:complete len:326 (-) Transcript_32432:82-1059(-)|eukprot:CAMPEP_0201492748 /NCGR_PEP_ID=MMETSP0151_2-20130828/34575_1 /ASSEMBLY_ACC=CAM_ASM_000257 /TAXON_ID=200890 /ORGANISM="Paramoeba atlantica, Strain 621/1 / CCAP 1560/9" /LENGTH=325 /DNA_ID=CAMNT_0047879749 /DNA_START=38 /DNA_END=1015 /DNA_ORIENTATION=+